MTNIDLPTLLRAYACGIFPMADSRTAPGVYWLQPAERAILPLDGFHLSRSLRKVLLSDRFTVTADRAFAQVIRLCAESADDRPETWINARIEDAFLALHTMGLAHSIECWLPGEDGEAPQLAGGLYGLALGRAFFGESMVSRSRDASKIAFAWLVARLRAGGFSVLDCQFMTPHLASLGAQEIPAAAYSALLDEAVADLSFESPLATSADFFALDALAPPLPSATRTVSAPVSGQLIAQLLTQTS